MCAGGGGGVTAGSSVRWTGAVLMNERDKLNRKAAPRSLL